VLGLHLPETGLAMQYLRMSSSALIHYILQSLGRAHSEDMERTKLMRMWLRCVVRDGLYSQMHVTKAQEYLCFRKITAVMEELLCYVALGSHVSFDQV
jgi:hypothetical protein